MGGLTGPFQVVAAAGIGHSDGQSEADAGWNSASKLVRNHPNLANSEYQAEGCCSA
jgi:hypothetical protein